jgi:hypothetical protein
VPRLFGLRYRLSLDHNFELLDANQAVRGASRMVGWWRFLTLSLALPSHDIAFNIVHAAYPYEEVKPTRREPSFWSSVPTQA